MKKKMVKKDDSCHLENRLERGEVLALIFGILAVGYLVSLFLR